MGNSIQPTQHYDTALDDLKYQLTSSNVENFSIDNWKQKVRQMDDTQVKPLLDWFLSRTWHFPTTRNIIDTGTECFAFLIERLAPLDPASMANQHKYHLNRLVAHMIRQNKVNAVRKLYTHTYTDNDNILKRYAVQFAIMYHATSKDMLELVSLNTRYDFPSPRITGMGIQRAYLEPWVRNDHITLMLNNLVDNLEMLEYFLEQKFEANHQNAWIQGYLDRFGQNDPWAAMNIRHCVEQIQQNWWRGLVAAAARSGNLEAFRLIVQHYQRFSTNPNVNNTLIHELRLNDILFSCTGTMNEFRGEEEFTRVENRRVLDSLEEETMNRGKYNIVMEIMNIDMSDIIKDPWIYELQKDVDVICQTENIDLSLKNRLKAFLAPIHTLLLNYMMIRIPGLLYRNGVYSNIYPEQIALYEKIDNCYANQLLPKVEGKNRLQIKDFYSNFVDVLVKRPRYYPVKVSEACAQAWALYFLYHEVHEKKFVMADTWTIDYAIQEFMTRKNVGQLGWRSKDKTVIRRSDRCQAGLKGHATFKNKLAWDNESKTSNKHHTRHPWSSQPKRRFYSMIWDEHGNGKTIGYSCNPIFRYPYSISNQEYKEIESVGFTKDAFSYIEGGDIVELASDDEDK